MFYVSLPLYICIDVGNAVREIDASGFEFPVALSRKAFPHPLSLLLWANRHSSAFMLLNVQKFLCDALFVQCC